MMAAVAMFMALDKKREMTGAKKHFVVMAELDRIELVAMWTCLRIGYIEKSNNNSHHFLPFYGQLNWALFDAAQILHNGW